MIFYFVLVVFVIGTKAEEVQKVNLTDNTYTWSSGSPYPIETKTVIVEAEEGYLIQVTVLECDIAGEDGDFMLIKAGTSLDDAGSGRVFTHILKSVRKYVIHSNTVFLQFVVFGLNEKLKSGAVVKFERFGEQNLITTESPVSTTVWPEHSLNDTIYYQNAITTIAEVNLYDNETVLEVRYVIAQMADAFCMENMIPLSENITEDNVLLQEMKLCPFYWPDMHKCAWLNFSLPVVLEENRTEWIGYELKRENLEIMWNKYAEQYLASIGLKPYVKPDDDYIMLMWCLIAGGVAVGFAIVLFIIRYLMITLARQEKREYSDTDSIISKHRDSNLSLDPHPLQSIPQLFENDFPMYEPGLSPSQEGYENHGIISDEESEDEIINTHTLNFNSPSRIQESES